MSEAQLQQGTAGRFGFLKQTAFDTENESADGSFHYYAFTNCDFGPIQQQGQLPQEAGNTKGLPRGTYKSGVFAAGGMQFIPRLENRFGYILEAAFGDASSYSNQTIAQVIADTGSQAGVNAHLFGFVDGDDFDLPYLTGHRLLPHDTEASQVGEIIKDIRVARFTLGVQAAQVVGADLQMLGRVDGTTVWDINPGWAEPSMDADNSFLVTSCAGSASLLITGGTPGTSTEFDTSMATLTVTNILSPPDAGRRIGSAHPKDYPCMGRTITIDLVTYVSSYDTYVQTFGGPADPVVDGAWSCTPLAGDVDVVLQSPTAITGSSYYQLRYRTTEGNVDWIAQPLAIMPNRAMLLALRGTVKQSSTGRPFFMWMQNAASNYD